MLYTDEEKIKQSLSNYQNPDITRRDVINTIQHYPSLTTHLEPFVFNDGSKRELFNLEGTIPVTYKGNTYNIPICIWLMDTHPYNAPMCYVKPTSGMQIKVSIFVDHNGKIYLPYLHDWVPNSSDLLGLIQVMIVTFGEQPPVYAKRPDMQSSTPYPTQRLCGPHSHLGCHEKGKNLNIPTQDQSLAIKPRGNFLNNLHETCRLYFSRKKVWSAYMPMPGGSSGSSAAPYPPYPTGLSYQPAASNQYPYPPYPSVYPNYPSTSFPYPPSTNHAFPSYPCFPGPPQSGKISSPPAINTANSSGGTTGTITEEHIRASLLSAVEDKVRRRLREQFSQMQAELETLSRTQQELLQGKSKLEDILARLEKEQVELDKNISILKDKEKELEKDIERLSEQQPLDVDEAVTTTAPLYKQLLIAFAEEAATEDAIYYMGEALRRGVIDLDVFLKQVRSLSRKQFMLHALMHKCRQKAGLAG
ncbi:Tumor susceptibility gene 101 protein [Cryptotermes secundus]|uniref:Tumor susceptibility gene 101 protein n=1 Tax=Cryptotermes secundus TaxID=105785 RepID=A0A2J7RDC5_9NEOP|nr:tumor susceptibility gene 101 protein isoform X3 [Cryptotermes secundus]PNF38835.1 Tumor susceptibility gene 101 protein [Cryptotermes secundus]